MEMARKSRMAALIVAAATVSCSKSATVDTTVADSAGVAIVTNSGTPALLDWTLDTVRVFGGDASGPATFHLVLQCTGGAGAVRFGLTLLSPVDTVGRICRTTTYVS